jgi:glycosyltransferase involved in cell wall biosynthesis
MTRGDDLDIALIALQQVRRRLPSARLALVGTGEGLGRLRALAAELDLLDAVRFPGWIDHGEVPAYLAAADVALYPYRDTLINRSKCSIKILEYMAMGKAILTHRVGQNQEYLEHRKSGLLVEPGEVDAFAEGLLTLLTDPTLSEQLGSRAAQQIEERFNWSKRIADVEKAYQAAYQPFRYSVHS